MNRQKEQSRSSANTAEVVVSIGFVLAWLLGAVVLLAVLPSGGQFGGGAELSALRGVQLPLLLIIAGVIGGLISFGVVGLFVGPVVLAATYTLTKDWVARGQPPQTND